MTWPDLTDLFHFAEKSFKLCLGGCHRLYIPYFVMILTIDGTP